MSTASFDSTNGKLLFSQLEKTSLTFSDRNALVLIFLKFLSLYVKFSDSFLAIGRLESFVDGKFLMGNRFPEFIW